MKRSVEELVNIVVAEVLAEISKRGGKPETNLGKAKTPPMSSTDTSVHVVDMTGFRSPVLLESHVASLAPQVKVIAVPEGTVMTPGAREIIRKKNLILKCIPKTN